MDLLYVQNIIKGQIQVTQLCDLLHLNQYYEYLYLTDISKCQIYSMLIQGLTECQAFSVSKTGISHKPFFFTNDYLLTKKLSCLDFESVSENEKTPCYHVHRISCQSPSSQIVTGCNKNHYCAYIFIHVQLYAILDTGEFQFKTLAHLLFTSFHAWYAGVRIFVVKS